MTPEWAFLPKTSTVRLHAPFLAVRTPSSALEVFGKKAHSGVNYLDGRSATVELGHMLVRLYENNDNERGIQFG